MPWEEPSWPSYGDGVIDLLDINAILDHLEDGGRTTPRNSQVTSTPKSKKLNSQMLNNRKTIRNIGSSEITNLISKITNDIKRTGIARNTPEYERLRKHIKRINIEMDETKLFNPWHTS